MWINKETGQQSTTAPEWRGDHSGTWTQVEQPRATQVSSTIYTPPATAGLGFAMAPAVLAPPRPPQPLTTAERWTLRFLLTVAAACLAIFLYLAWPYIRQYRAEQARASGVAAGLARLKRGASGLPAPDEQQVLKQIHEAVSSISWADGGPVWVEDDSARAHALQSGGYGVAVREKSWRGERASGFVFQILPSPHGPVTYKLTNVKNGPWGRWGHLTE